jgi:hypothetical protein
MSFRVLVLNDPAAWGHGDESEGVLEYRHSNGVAPVEYRLADSRSDDRVHYEAALRAGAYTRPLFSST